MVGSVFIGSLNTMRSASMRALMQVSRGGMNVSGRGASSSMVV